MNTFEYIQTVSQLGQALITDPQTLLALTVAWLDPLAILNDYQSLIADDLTDYYYAGDTVGEGLHVTRTCFPDIYAHAIAKLRQDIPITDVLQFIDGEIERQTSIPMSDYCAEEFFYSFGIPMPWYGLDLDDPDFCERYPDAWHLMHLFGSTIDEHQTTSYATHIDLSQEMWLAAHVLHASLYDYRENPLHQALMHAIGFVFACSGNSCVLCGIETHLSRSNPLTPDTILQSGKIYTVGGIIADSLEQQEAEAYQQLSWTVKWLFSCSNNSCVDWDAETMYSVEPLAWTPEDVAFAVELIAEAETIMADAVAGLAWVKEEVGVLLALCYNTQQINQILANNPEYPVDVSLIWPDLLQDPVTQIKTLLEEWECLPVQST